MEIKMKLLKALILGTILCGSFISGAYAMEEGMTAAKRHVGKIPPVDSMGEEENLDAETNVPPLLTFVIDNYEKFLANLAPSETKGRWGSGGGREKLVYALAKYSHTTIEQVHIMMNVLQLEVQLRPHVETIRKYVEKYLNTPFEIDTVYEETVPLENINFNSKLYIGNMSSGWGNKTDPLEVSILHSNWPARSNGERSSPPFKNKFEELSKNNYDFYLMSNNIYFPFGFRKPGTTLGGFLILEKPIDYHSLTKACLK
jgi:hypothetical protein